MLEPDLEETSTALLLSIAQSQWRSETGNSNQSLPMVDIPAFEPTASARWINALWFLALALSLGAAMMAMLAKEWLAAFRAWPPRHPFEFALKRQARLDGFESWHAIQMIDFLPTLLHISLVLFSCGLIIRLWDLDPVIAMIVGVVSGTITLAYVAATISAAMKKGCPYRTRVSYYLRKFLDYQWDKHSRGDKAVKNSTTVEVIPNLSDTDKAMMFRSLEWLAENARDPNIGNCVWEALAVTVLGTVKTRQRKNSNEQGCQTNEMADNSCQQVSESQPAVTKMNTRDPGHLLKSLKKYVHRLKFCGSLSAAATLPEIYYYVAHCLSQSQTQDDRPSASNRVLKLYTKIREHVGLDCLHLTNKMMY